MRPLSSFGLFDWFVTLAAGWLLYQGIRGAWRREIFMFGHVGGRSWRHAVRGPWAVVGGLAWAAGGLVVLYRTFLSVD